MTREEREEAISTLEYIKEYCHYEYEKETIDKVREALNQEPILDKIRAEIMQLDYDIDTVYYDYNDMPQTETVHIICREEVLRIIDEYKEESEE